MSRDIALLEAFAAELKARRAVLKWSQEELAFRADVNRTYIAKLELARNQPTLSVLHSLATALNSDMPALLGNALARYHRSVHEYGILPSSDSSEPINASGEIGVVTQRAISQTSSPTSNNRRRQVVLEFDSLLEDPRGTNRLAEIAAVELVNGRVTGNSFHMYLDPGIAASSAAFSKFKPSREFLSGRPMFSDVATDLVRFIDGAEILTHSSFYPYLEVIDEELARINLPSLSEFGSKIISTFALARKLLKIKSPTLVKLCVRFELDPSKYIIQPNAMTEALLLAEVYVRMCPSE